MMFLSWEGATLQEQVWWQAMIFHRTRQFSSRTIINNPSLFTKVNLNFTLALLAKINKTSLSLLQKKRPFYRLKMLIGHNDFFLSTLVPLLVLVVGSSFVVHDNRNDKTAANEPNEDLF